MRNKVYWGLGVFIVLFIGVFVLVMINQHVQIKQLETEAKKAEAKANQMKDTPPVTREGHEMVQHGDHSQEVPITPDERIDVVEKVVKIPVSRDYEPTRVQIPEGITDPEVKAAWERLDYIANNIWEWGGVPSARAVELIDMLMPPPGRFSGPKAHDDAEDTINLLGELAWSGDPRAAEAVATYYCEGIIGGTDPRDALVAIGPPAVPYLIPYLLDDNTAGAVGPLGEIAVKYREDLGGITEHIIIPRFEEIAAIENPTTQMVYPKILAQEALSRLK